MRDMFKDEDGERTFKRKERRTFESIEKKREENPEYMTGKKHKKKKRQLGKSQKVKERKEKGKEMIFL